MAQNCFFRAMSTLFLAAVTAACASTAEQTFVAPTNQTVTSRLEATYDAHVQQVVVQNASTVEVVVNSVTLRDCENIKTRCEVHRLRVPVKPGQRKPVFTITKGRTDQGHSFRYTFTWEGAKVDPPLPGQ